MSVKVPDGSVSSWQLIKFSYKPVGGSVILRYAWLLCVSQGLLCSTGVGPLQAQRPVGNPGEASAGCQDSGGEDLFWTTERVWFLVQQATWLDQHPTHPSQRLSCELVQSTKLKFSSIYSLCEWFTYRIEMSKLTYILDNCSQKKMT